MSKLEARVKELEERTELITGMILGLLDRISHMDDCFVMAIEEVRKVAISLPGKKIPKASQGGSSVRSSTPNKKRQSTLRADSSRSSRNKG